MSIPPSFMLRASPFILLLLLLANELAAQSFDGMSVDSATWERRLATYPQPSIEERARAYLHGRIEREDKGGIEPLREFMRIRTSATAWMSDEEELLLLLYLGRSDALLDTITFDRLLRGITLRDAAAYPSAIALRPLLHSAIRRDMDDVIGHLIDRSTDDDDAAFLLLLINGATVRGVRTVDDYNEGIDRFIDEFDTSRWHARARRLYKVAVPESIGLGLHLAYHLVQPMSETPINRLHGPTLTGALYVDRFRFDVTAHIHAVEFSRRIMIGTEVWERGVGTSYGIAASLGYDIPWGRGWTGLFAGGRLSEMEGVTTGSNDDAPSTGLRFAPLVGVRTGWRIPFDQPPHIDLNLVAMLATRNLPQAYEIFDAMYLSIGLGFGLIQRPYHVVFDRSR